MSNATRIASASASLGLIGSLLTATPAYAGRAYIKNVWASAYAINVYDRSDCSDARARVERGATKVGAAIIVHAYFYVKDDGGAWKGPYWGGYCRRNPAITWRDVKVASNA